MILAAAETQPEAPKQQTPPGEGDAGQRQTGLALSQGALTPSAAQEPVAPVRES